MWIKIFSDLERKVTDIREKQEQKVHSISNSNTWSVKRWLIWSKNMWQICLHFVWPHSDNSVKESKIKSLIHTVQQVSPSQLEGKDKSFVWVTKFIQIVHKKDPQSDHKCYISKYMNTDSLKPDKMFTLSMSKDMHRFVYNSI